MNDFKNKTLSIAGSDSGAGAGIQADLKTFSSLGVYGATVITAVTAQNTVGVQDVVMMSGDFVSEQINSVMSDIKPSSIKTGMLGNSEIINAVCKSLEGNNYQDLVVDPVMIAESGDSLIDDSAISSYINKLFPLSTLVTPNIHEAEKIAKIKINSKDSLIKCGRLILDMGANRVLIKGGHWKEDIAEDFLFSEGEMIRFSETKINTKNTHGTGCTLSAAITAFLSMGDSVEFSIRKAKEYITNSLKYSYSIGEGNSPVNHFHKK